MKPTWYDEVFSQIETVVLSEGTQWKRNFFCYFSTFRTVPKPSRRHPCRNRMIIDKRDFFFRDFSKSLNLWKISAPQWRQISDSRPEGSSSWVSFYPLAPRKLLEEGKAWSTSPVINQVLYYGQKSIRLIFWENQIRFNCGYALVCITSYSHWKVRSVTLREPFWDDKTRQ